MKAWVVITLGFLIAGVASASTPAPPPTPPTVASESSVLGFQAWKTTRVDEARSSLERLQAEKSSGGGKGAEKVVDKKSISASGRLQKSSRPDQKVQQAQLNLEIAKELSVNDYFVLYLSQFKLKEDFLGAAKQLSPEESAELLMAYQKHLSGTLPVEVVVPPTSPTTSLRP